MPACDTRSRIRTQTPEGLIESVVIPVILRGVKTAVSLPDDLYERAEQAAQQLGVNRSQLYARALTKYLQDIGPDPVTVRLNELAAEHGKERTAPESSAAARSMIDSGGWEW